MPSTIQIIRYRCLNKKYLFKKRSLQKDLFKYFHHRYKPKSFEESRHINGHCCHKVGFYIAGVTDVQDVDPNLVFHCTARL